MKMLPKILLAFVVLIVLSLAQALFGYVSLQNTADGMSDVSRYPVAQVDAARSAWNSFRSASELLTAEMQMIEHGEVAQRVADLGKLIGKFEGEIKRYLDNNPTEESQQLAQGIAKDFKQWRTGAQDASGNIGANCNPCASSNGSIAKYDRKIAGSIGRDDNCKRGSVT